MILESLLNSAAGAPLRWAQLRAAGVGFWCLGRADDGGRDRFLGIKKRFFEVFFEVL